MTKDGEAITEPDEILYHTQKYFEELYSSKSSHSMEECFKFVGNAKTKKLNDEERNKLEGKLTIKECYDSLKIMANNKTSGNDGLSKELYLAFWSELGQDMVNSFNHSFQKGELSTTQKQVIITLLEKPDKDTRFFENWRPIKSDECRC